MVNLLIFKILKKKEDSRFTSAKQRAKPHKKYQNYNKKICLRSIACRQFSEFFQIELPARQ